jgi:O-acetylhomoserine/O-acetylserine sulfhydrylase-like pyridoxal-dependent enzyme
MGYTIKVHAGYRADQHNNAVSVPIYQTTAFALGDRRVFRISGERLAVFAGS